MEVWIANNYMWVLPTIVALLGALWVVANGILKFGKWQGKLDIEISAFREFSKEMRCTIKEMNDKITKILTNLNRLPLQTTASASPAQLTEFGTEISDELFVKEWVIKHAPSIDTTDRADFVVHDKCMVYVAQQFETDTILSETIRAGAYKFGTSIDNITKVYEVELRNTVLDLLERSPET